MQDKNNDLLEKAGVNIGEGKLNIDLNQTRDFFNALKETLRKYSPKFTKEPL